MAPPAQRGIATLSVAPSSSGLGRRAFIPKIAGSIPAGVTIGLNYGKR